MKSKRIHLDGWFLSQVKLSELQKGSGKFKFSVAGRMGGPFQPKHMHSARTQVQGSTLLVWSGSLRGGRWNDTVI
ncbi:UNVERIFIED_CONTAM: hypothetical protein FKN15_068625 [Acipenser sinensis]